MTRPMIQIVDENGDITEREMTDEEIATYVGKEIIPE